MCAFLVPMRSLKSRGRSYHRAPNEGAITPIGFPGYLTRSYYIAQCRQKTRRIVNCEPGYAVCLFLLIAVFQTCLGTGRHPAARAAVSCRDHRHSVRQRHRILV